MFRPLLRAANSSLKLVSPRAALDFAIARRDSRFEREFWLLPELVRNRIAIDIGGSVGAFAYQMSKTAKHVHTFEPNPSSLKEMRRFLRKNITVHAVALSDRVGRQLLRFDPSFAGFGTIEPKNTMTQTGVNASCELDVELRTLDSYGLPEVDFVKIDVEGHEPSVVRGAIETIRRCQPLLMIECELRHNPKGFEELLSILQPLDYKPRYWDGSHFIPVAAEDIGALQVVESAVGYVNNFFFSHPSRPLLPR